MATATINSLSISTTTSSLFDGKASTWQPPSATPQCVSLPSLPPLPVHSLHCRKIARNVVAMASTGEAPAAAPVVTPTTADSTDEAPEFADPSDLLKTIQQAWDKVEDKYAVSSLAVAGFVSLWGATGLISTRLNQIRPDQTRLDLIRSDFRSDFRPDLIRPDQIRPDHTRPDQTRPDQTRPNQAIDRLPLLPGVLELVGIGYSGWFAYRNLISKTDRDALIQKINNTYKDIIGSS